MAEVFLHWSRPLGAAACVAGQPEIPNAPEELLRLSSAHHGRYLVRTAVAVPCRWHGGGVPEYWGRDSPYHGGTDFLGTPKNHLDLVSKRPVSPHVFEIDMKQVGRAGRERW